MPNKAIVATYADLEAARDVISQLEAAGFERSNIGLATRDLPMEDVPDEGAAMVVLSVDEGKILEATETMKSHPPAMIDTRDIQWRKEGDWREFIPDARDFSAVPIND